VTKAIMLYKLGRLLQVIGLVLLPLAMAGNLVPDAPVNLRNMLALMALGVVIFFVGWKMQEMGKGK
jgi:predicted acyltransferase